MPNESQVSHTDPWHYNHLQQTGLTQVKHKVLVSSGKGGVGKSTVAANLAAAFHVMGLRVGLLDADIHGPSQAVMWQLPENVPVPVHEDPNFSLPFESHGVKVTTLATRMTDSHPVQWRGPMLSMAVINLLCHTWWGELDVLVVDMPPGTGDVHVSICDKLPDSGVVTVTTPQQVAVADTRRGMQQYVEQKIKLLGVVENMSAHVCEACGHMNTLFGESGATQLSAQFDTPVLGSLPMHAHVREASDAGKPLMLQDASHVISKIYLQIAHQVWSRMHD
jgi:ATP-binding protein involved in chromosome partitioning